MANFAWIIPLDKATALGSGGISPNYIIPNQHLLINPTKLKEAKIWIVIRGQHDRCIALVKPKRIERFTEGYQKDDFLMTTDLKKSIRLTQDYDSSKLYTINHTQTVPVGLHEITEEESIELQLLVKKNLQIKLLPPNLGITKAKLKVNSKDLESLATMALSQITLNFSLDQLWGSGTGYKLRPFSNFALQLLYNEGSKPEVLTINALNENDPTNYLLDNNTSKDNDASNSKSSKSRPVDLDFTEIDPATIYAREFIFSDKMPFDIEEALNKTEVAEKIHQDMLRDISLYLRKIGLVPYESESVDLMVDHRGKTKIFEIKSANDDNLLAQSAKGAFQVAWYLDAMTSNYDALEGSLILHKVAQSDLQSMVSRVLNRMQINHLVYDPSLDWPERIKGFLEE